MQSDCIDSFAMQGHARNATLHKTGFLHFDSSHQLRRFIVGTLAFAAALSLGEAGRVYLLDGNIWTTWVAWPIGAMFMLFPASFAVNTLWHCFHSMPILRGEQAHRSTSFANQPIVIRGMV